MHNIEFLGLNPKGGDNTDMIDQVVVAAVQDEVLDGGFETPVLTANTYQVAPGESAWQFSGTAGISGNNSGLTSGTPNAPQGAQVGFIQANANISQSVYLDAETYNISFMASQREANQTLAQSQEIEVLVDGSPVALVTPYVLNSTNFPIAYTLFDTSTFTVAAGVHTIEFLGMSAAGAKNTAFIDEVSLNTLENTFSNPDFAAPAQQLDGYTIAPTGAAWQFTGIAGVAANNSGFNYISANARMYAPSGVQVAFIKNNGSMSQTVYFDAGTYNISFLATQRILDQTQPQQIEVLVDGSPVALVTPAVTTTFGSTPSNTNYLYTPYQTSNFSVAAGPHTVEFLGMSQPNGNSVDSTAFVDVPQINLGSALVDGSFEEPALAAKSYAIAPTASPWQFTGISGVSSNASAFTFGNPVAPNGAQVAFIKNNATVSQSVYLAAGVYNLSFMAAQREQHQTTPQILEILVDGNEVGMVTPDSDTNGNYPVGTSFGLYATSSFTVSAGTHTIEFVGLSPNTPATDSTAFIDNVLLNV